MLIKTYSAAVMGVGAMTVTVEVNLSGQMGLAIVGLPDNAVKESKERIEAAIKNVGLDFPRGKLVINLAPADVRKEGSAFDLPIAIGILAASGQINEEKLPKAMFIGELSLDGSLNPVRGALPMAIQARNAGFEELLLPEANAGEAGVVNKLNVIPLQNLKQAVEYLNGKIRIEPANIDTRALFEDAQEKFTIDFANVRGQDGVKRALEVAAAGGHNLIMIGPPGSGKTMLARRISTILPPLTLNEALETTKIHSVAGKLGKNTGLVANRPFRAPHHTVSDVALVGGGNTPSPGEISLAHNGVLFLDELPEFKRTVLEVLRQPVEERRITISRAKFTVEYPASFMLVASMNPCPCGFFNHPDKSKCLCPPGLVQKYLSRISGPLLDRIDLHIEVTPVPFDELSAEASAESSESIRNRVIAARDIQLKRFQSTPEIYSNAMMDSAHTREHCALDKPTQNMLKKVMERLDLSARAYDRILKVSRTIADLVASDEIRFEHVAEAVNYRNLDKQGWAG